IRRCRITTVSPTPLLPSPSSPYKHVSPTVHTPRISCELPQPPPPTRTSLQRVPAARTVSPSRTQQAVSSPEQSPPVSGRGTSGNRSGEQSCLEVQVYCPGAPKHTNVSFALTGCNVLWAKKDWVESVAGAR